MTIEAPDGSGTVASREFTTPRQCPADLSLTLAAISIAVPLLALVTRPKP
ncbi:hypothetical protein [Kribbella sp. NPDC055071]